MKMKNGQKNIMILIQKKSFGAKVVVHLIMEKK